MFTRSFKNKNPGCMLRWNSRMPLCFTGFTTNLNVWCDLLFLKNKTDHLPYLLNISFRVGQLHKYEFP